MLLILQLPLSSANLLVPTVCGDPLQSTSPTVSAVVACVGIASPSKRRCTSPPILQTPTPPSPWPFNAADLQQTFCPALRGPLPRKSWTETAPSPAVPGRRRASPLSAGPFALNCSVRAEDERLNFGGHRPKVLCLEEETVEERTYEKPRRHGSSLISPYNSIATLLLVTQHSDLRSVTVGKVSDAASSVQSTNSRVAAESRE